MSDKDLLWHVRREHHLEVPEPSTPEGFEKLEELHVNDHWGRDQDHDHE